MHVRVLVIAGDDIERKSQASLLNGAGFCEVRAVSAMHEAIEMYTEWCPDLILCNESYPGEDITALPYRIDNIDTLSYRPILIAVDSTDSVMRDGIRRDYCMDNGFTEYTFGPLVEDDVKWILAKARINSISRPE